MKRSILAILILFGSGISLQAQSLYMPRNIQDAYRKGSRSMDGKPGLRYWQNSGRYDIKVNAFPPDRVLRGSEQIVYYNQSPDTLRNIVIRLILNIHRPGANRVGTADSNYLTSGIHIDAYSENGLSKPWKMNNPSSTAQRVSLTKPLLPNDSLQLAFDWHYEISKESNREGMIDSTTYYLAYFYPRVSVYDDYNGWDMLPFTDQQEFYNDFNDYTLTVSVPRNYLVWSTGELQNPKEVLQGAFAEKLNLSMTSDSVFHIVTSQDLAGKNITALQPVNSWVWKAQHVSDMAVGLSDHYVWDASSVVVDESTRRRASIQAAFLDKAIDFHKSVEYAKYALAWYSNNWPGVPYPFPKMTAFQGFADMEYPMMVNDASTGGNLVFARLVQDHEIAHSYFPFYMGINESRYAFMDEGWATALELLIGRSELDASKADNMYKQFRVNDWINDRSSEEDLPIITPANVLNSAAYGNNAYGKPALGYLALRDMLGDELFKKSLHEYMSRWHGKHPIPWDFFHSMSDASGMNLNWFWNNWFFSNNYIDFAIQQVEKTKSGYRVLVQNIGGYVAPFDLVIRYEDSSQDIKHQTPALWRANQQLARIEVLTNKKILSLKIDGGIFMDADESNNSWKP